MLQTVKMVLGVVVVLVAAAVAGQIGREAGGSLLRRSTDVTSVSALTRVASEANKSLPMMVDKETELSNASALPGILVYNYRFVNGIMQEISAQELIGRLKPSTTTRACTTPETRDGLLKRGVTMRYSYSDRNGAFIAAFDVTPDACKP
jgi:hypothetical protein